MASLFLILLLLISTLQIHANTSTNPTHLHFYMHDTVTGKNPTAIQIIKGPSKYNSRPGQLGFGSVLMIDDPLTAGPNFSSNIVGRAQGFYAFAGLSGNELLLSMNILFNGGKYNGSSVSVFGRDSILDEVRELPIIGGAGKFRIVRGYILIKTVSFVPSMNNAILEIDFYAYNSSMNSIPSSDDGVINGDDASKGGVNGLYYPNIVSILVIYCFLGKSLMWVM